MGKSQRKLSRLGRNAPAKKAAPWGIIAAIDWVEANFSKLLLLDPACFSMYDGCDENGASMRRYAIGAPVAAAEEDSEEEVDSEEEERYAQEELQRRIAELLASTEDGGNDKKKLSEAEIERRKQEAMEMGEKAKTLSKKEREELNKTRKEKAGHRMAKTGASHRKFEGEGATSKEDKKKKN